jgi:hypothetical protein
VFGAGAKSQGALIKLLFGAGTGGEITNCGSGSGFFLFTTDFKKLDIEKNHGFCLCKFLQF